MVGFCSLKSDLAERLSQVGEVLRLIKHLDIDLDHLLAEPGVRSLKGLLFVQFYASYEFTVVNSFAATIRQLNILSIPLKHLKLPTLGLALHTTFKSYQDTSERRGWLTKIKLMDLCQSHETSAIPEQLFPRDESQFRTPQLDIICQLMSLPPGALLPSLRLKGWIEEVVENRNAIAHGRETAETIGGRFTSHDLEIRLNQLNLLCNHIVATLEVHSATRSNFEKQSI